MLIARPHHFWKMVLINIQPAVTHFSNSVASVFKVLFYDVGTASFRSSSPALGSFSPSDASRPFPSFSHPPITCRHFFWLHPNRHHPDLRTVMCSLSSCQVCECLRLQGNYNPLKKTFSFTYFCILILYSFVSGLDDSSNVTSILQWTDGVCRESAWRPVMDWISCGFGRPTVNK